MTVDLYHVVVVTDAFHILDPYMSFVEYMLKTRNKNILWKSKTGHTGIEACKNNNRTSCKETMVG